MRIEDGSRLVHGQARFDAILRMASVEFYGAVSKLSTTLLGVSGSLPAGKVSLRDLLELIGEQGMLLVCVFLTLPFLLPVSIPGVSTVFGLAIILIGVGVSGGSGRPR